VTRHWFKRTCEDGGFARMLEGLAAEGTDQKAVMIDVEPVVRHGSRTNGETV
jgi:hypothetical protein